MGAEYRVQTSLLDRGRCQRVRITPHPWPAVWTQPCLRWHSCGGGVQHAADGGQYTTVSLSTQRRKSWDSTRVAPVHGLQPYLPAVARAPRPYLLHSPSTRPRPAEKGRHARWRRARRRSSKRRGGGRGTRRNMGCWASSPAGQQPPPAPVPAAAPDPADVEAGSGGHQGHEQVRLLMEGWDYCHFASQERAEGPEGDGRHTDPAGVDDLTGGVAGGHQGGGPAPLAGGQSITQGKSGAHTSK